MTLTGHEAPSCGGYNRLARVLELKSFRSRMDSAESVGAAMQQIANWLQKLGLGQYAQRFAENDITFDILPDLSDQDFEKIGVASLGHRRQLLRAIVELKGAPQFSPVAPVPPRDGAERRQVTVIFSDLVGSTALSARIDPEDLREVISAYQKCVTETVQRFGGFVAKYMGDGVLVYFGYPQAHEDDAERAVRAGLELVAAVGALKGEAPLQTRVGIATGLVVVGDLIGSGASQEQAIVGETPNLAARLQSIAEPNRVVLAGDTRKLLGNLFELEDLGARDLKGIAGPVRAWVAPRFRGKPLRCSSRERPDRACRSRRRTRTVGAAVVESKDRRGPSGALVGRAWYRQVSTDGRAARASKRRAAHEDAIFLLATAHRQWPSIRLSRSLNEQQHSSGMIYPKASSKRSYPCLDRQPSSIPTFNFWPSCCRSPLVLATPH